MRDQALAKPTSGAQALERVLIEGDLAALSPEQRIEYYQRVCESTGLNPMTKPFDYLRLNGKLILYAKRDATDQLRKLHGVSITKLERERLDDVYCVTAYAATADGRTDSSLGAVPVQGLKGEALANAYMKAETKSKRRVTLSICGLGLLDETEIGSIPGAMPEPTIVESKSLPGGDRAAPRTVDASPESASRAVDSAPAGGDFREPGLQEWAAFYDKVSEHTGYLAADVDMLLGRPVLEHMQAMHRNGRVPVGKTLLNDLIAYKREGRPVPGVPTRVTA